MVTVWSSLPGNRSMDNYTKMGGISEIFVCEECVIILLTLTEAIECIPVVVAVQVM